MFIFSPQVNHNIIRSLPLQEQYFGRLKTSVASPELLFAGEPSQLKRTGIKGWAPLQWTNRQVEYGMRLVANQLINWKAKKTIEEIHKAFENVDPHAPNYLHSLLAAGYFLAGQMPLQLEMNMEDNPFQRLVAKNESAIFMMNHDYQLHDPMMLSYVGLLLYQVYFQAGKGETCPRPAILMNEDILKAMPDKLREIYVKLGAVGVDASLTSTSASMKTNVSVMKPLISDLVKNKRHIFIFPEGRNAGKHHWDLKDRFQPGIADLVLLATSRKGSLDVYPVGFAVNKRKKVPNPLYDPSDKTSAKKLKLASVYVGEPIVFQAQEKTLVVNVANMTPDNAPDSYRKFLFQLPPKKKPKVVTVWQRIGRGIGKFKWWGKKSSDQTNFSKIQPTLPTLSNKELTPDMLKLGYQLVNGVPSKTLTEGGVPVPFKETTPYIKDVLEENLRICRAKALEKLPQTVEPEPIGVGVYNTTGPMKAKKA
jgi:hypothetical protein